MEQQKGYTLTQDQIDFWHENGYLHLKKVFSDELCEALGKEADRSEEHTS